MKIFAKSMLAKSACTLALAASAAMAGESFGGIGVTIYATPDGVRVVDVVPGSPAAEAGLEKDDRIVAVDGVSLAGNDIEESKALLRGTVGKPLEVSVRREKESYSFTLRRAHIAVNEIASADVQEWYDDPSASKAYTPAEISEVARKSLGSNYELLSVMKDGRVIPEDMTVGASELSSVSIEKTDSRFEAAPAKSRPRAAGSLKSFDRAMVSFDLKKEGTTVVRIVSANGEEIARLLKEDAKAGRQSLSWNGKNAASGRYIVHIEQNGASSAAAAELR